MVSSLFNEIQNNKKHFLCAKKGEEFEDRISYFLKTKIGFQPLQERDFTADRFKTIKDFVLKKDSVDFLNVLKKEKRSYIYQPFGSQEYPDFLIFSNAKVIPIEIKYTKNKQKVPTWNSNLPKANGFYIFGSYGLSDITFFCGADVLDMKRRKKLIDFFDNSLRSQQDKFNTDLKYKLEDNKRTGFFAYVRIAYQQKKGNNPIRFSFFDTPRRQDIEQKAIRKIKDLE